MAGVVAMDVEATFTLDVPDLVKRMDGAVIKVFQKARRDLVTNARQKWRGWEYKGRPVSKRNISINAWESTIQATEAPYSFTVENHARSVYGGKPYVDQVHRAGSDEKECAVLFRSWGESKIPEIEANLTRAILAEIGKPGPVKKRRANRVTTSTKLVLT